MNLIYNAYFLRIAGENIPVSNDFTITGSVSPSFPDSRIVAIDELARDLELIKDSKDITISTERESPNATGSMALSFYIKGKRITEIKITANLYDSNDVLINTQYVFFTPDLLWERVIDKIIAVTDLTKTVTLKFENTSSVDPIYIAMPQFEEGSSSSAFVVGG